MGVTHHRILKSHPFWLVEVHDVGFLNDCAGYISPVCTGNVPVAWRSQQSSWSIIATIISDELVLGVTIKSDRDNISHISSINPGITTCKIKVDWILLPRYFPSTISKILVLDYHTQPSVHFPASEQIPLPLKWFYLFNGIGWYIMVLYVYLYLCTSNAGAHY